MSVRKVVPLRPKRHDPPGGDHVTNGRQGAVRVRSDENDAVKKHSIIVFGHMTSAIDQFCFSEPARAWWNRLTQLQLRQAQTFDLKKIGTFPIVHGARVLALEHRLTALGTVERLQNMASLSILPAALVLDLIEILHMLMAFKIAGRH